VASRSYLELDRSHATVSQDLEGYTGTLQLGQRMSGTVDDSHVMTGTHECDDHEDAQHFLLLSTVREERAERDSGGVSMEPQQTK